MKGSNIPSRALASLLLLAVAEAVPLNRTLVAEATLITTSGDLPDYAITYAPYLYLNSDESWFPSNIDTHLSHVTPEINFVALSGAPSPLSDSNLDFYTDNGTSVFLTSDDDVAASPQASWITSDYGKPDADGVSVAQVHVIAVDKGELIGAGVVDVFYCYFYSWNQGPKVLDAVTFGDHVGDWEHNMIRFKDGVPQEIFYSQHSDGFGYTWDAVAKNGDRPVVYVALGTHANYPTAGTQFYTPGVWVLWDSTNKGTYWDPVATYYSFWYSAASGFVPATGTTIGTSYLDYEGAWGDEQYALTDSRQYCVTSDECLYDNGPTGPIDKSKNLLRTTLCASSNCAAQTTIETDNGFQ